MSHRLAGPHDGHQITRAAYDPGHEDADHRSPPTGSRETVRDITGECAAFASTAAEGGDGLLHVFVPHATAGIALIELGARSDDDLLTTLADLLPADDRWRHAHGSRGHGRSRIMPAFVRHSDRPGDRRPPGPRHGSPSLVVDLNVDNPDRRVRLSFLG